jgi:hypothetical protein
VTVSIEQRSDGLCVKVRAAPGARQDRIVGVYGDAVKISVTAPPEGGRANERLCAVLARALDLPRRSVQVVGGATSRDKRVLITSLDIVELQCRLSSLLQT